jgi:hypothetical protein
LLDLARLAALRRPAELAARLRHDPLLLGSGGHLRLAGLLRLTSATASLLGRLPELTARSRPDPLLLGAGRRLLAGLLRLTWATASLLGRLAELAARPRSATLLGRVRRRLSILLSAPRPSAALRLAHLTRCSLRPGFLRLPTALPRPALWRRALRALLRSSRLRAGRGTFLAPLWRRLLAPLPGIVLGGAGLREHDGICSGGAIIGQARARKCNRR